MSIGRTVLWLVTAGYCGKTKQTVEVPEEKPLELFPEEVITDRKTFSGLTESENSLLKNTKSINEARNLQELKQARESIIEDLVTIQEKDGVTLEDLNNEFSFERNYKSNVEEDFDDVCLTFDSLENEISFSSRIKNEINPRADLLPDAEIIIGDISPPKSKPLVDAIFLTKSVEDVQKLKYAAVRAGIRKYGLYPERFGKDQSCYLLNNNFNSRERKIDFYSSNYTDLQLVLQQQRDILNEHKAKAGIKTE